MRRLAQDASELEWNSPDPRHGKGHTLVGRLPVENSELFKGNIWVRGKNAGGTMSPGSLNRGG